MGKDGGVTSGEGRSGASDVLAGFSDPTRTWFEAAFAAPTPAQVGAWETISAGRNALVVAPTGSGKTLSAFLWSLDRLASQPPPEDKLRRCKVLYVSPLKALAVDVERNLRAPLIGIRQTAERLGSPVRDISVGVRSGDTPAQERRRLATTPPDILITTPESLFLMLTSQAREALRGVETVIVDEVHAVAGTKRGAHLALSLERLDALLDEPAQRIGLSATVRPVEEVARFLGGSRPVEVVAPGSSKQWDLQVVVPVEDMTELALAQLEEPPEGSAAGSAERRSSIWPHVEERVVDLIERHRSTIVFANSRRLAERLTARFNEIAAERAGVEDPDELDQRDGPPAQLMAQSGQSYGAAPVIARAHHGSVSKEQRALIEDDLKRGALPCVVATSSLELGIDMGAVDLVVQIESPPSVASALQRVGRAGHQVGEVSRGVLFPKHRSDLVHTAVAVERMRAGEIESLRVPANPRDVLAQQVVAATAVDEWDADELYDVVRRSAPFTAVPGRGGVERVVVIGEAARPGVDGDTHRDGEDHRGQPGCRQPGDLTRRPVPVGTSGAPLGGGPGDGGLGGLRPARGADREDEQRHERGEPTKDQEGREDPDHARDGQHGDQESPVDQHDAKGAAPVEHRVRRADRTRPAAQRHRHQVGQGTEEHLRPEAGGEERGEPRDTVVDHVPGRRRRHAHRQGDQRADQPGQTGEHGPGRVRRRGLAAGGPHERHRHEPEHAQQLPDVFEVETRRGLVEDIEGPAGRALGQFGRKLHALCLAAR